MLSGLDQPLQLGDAIVDDLHPLFGQVSVVRANPGTENVLLGKRRLGGTDELASTTMRLMPLGAADRAIRRACAVREPACRTSGGSLQLDPPSLDEPLARAQLGDTSVGA
jgi:hypothetical protein